MKKDFNTGLRKGIEADRVKLTRRRKLLPRDMGLAEDLERGLKRLEKRFRTGRITKDKLNNRGYNRFLTMTGDATVGIDYDKVARDKCLDGYKGYTTNSSLPDDRVIEEYGYLL